jgi:DNA-directed RNA polymerase III subunit RPC4
MTASGPFAMGPTLAGSSIRRSAPRSNFAPTAPVTRTSTSFGDNPPSSVPLSLKSDVGNTNVNVKNGAVKTEDGEYYSDPDEGVEIVDMEDVHQLDWMAPDSIRKERQKSQKTIKKESQSAF